MSWIVPPGGVWAMFSINRSRTRLLAAVGSPSSAPATGTNVSLVGIVGPVDCSGAGRNTPGGLGVGEVTGVGAVVGLGDAVGLGGVTGLGDAVGVAVGVRDAVGLGDAD